MLAAMAERHQWRTRAASEALGFTMSETRTTQSPMDFSAIAIRASRALERPSREVIELMGAVDQALPALIAAEGADERFATARREGQRFIEGKARLLVWPRGAGRRLAPRR